MFQSLRIYLSHSGEKMRVMAVYPSGASCDFETPIPETNPIHIELPSTGLGDKAITIAIHLPAEAEEKDKHA